MKFFLALLSLVVIFAAAVPAVAGPGDPRLVNGILEWPRTVSGEPFIVVRGDDGVVYYIAIGAARHEASLAAGGRVAVLGLEGRTAHEINALGIGAGESVEAALANLQGARPAATAAAPVAPSPNGAAASSPNGGAAVIATPNGKPLAPTPPAAAAPAPNGKAAAVAPAPVVTSPVPPVPAPVVTSPAPPAPAPVVTSPAPTAPAPAVTTPAPTPPPPMVTAPAPTSPAVTPQVPTSPAPVVTPPPAGGGAPLIISTPTPSPVRSAAAPPPARRSVEVTTPAAVPASTSTEERRWTEISGVVESLVGRTLILRSEEGRVAVDLSALSQNLERMITPGAHVRVYGVPVEVRFKAMGFLDPGTRP